MLSETTYYFYVHVLIVLNTLDILGKAAICYGWTTIVREQKTKTVFAMTAGALAMFALVRLLVAAMPTTYEALLAIGVVYTLVNYSSTSAMGLMTWIVKKRKIAHLSHLTEGRTEADILDEVIGYFDEHGRAKGWR